MAVVLLELLGGDDAWFATRHGERGLIDVTKAPTAKGLDVSKLSGGGVDDEFGL